EVGAGRCQKTDEGVLQRVDVLVLVDGDPAEALPVECRELGMLPKESHGLEEEIVEVDKVPSLQRLCIAGGPLANVPFAQAAEARDLVQQALGPHRREIEQLANDLQ